ncbi:uncharacterized protein LACBIDRAFT_317122 [Laccaria bicolor S238N-H82]|uniref:Predicted protein n=1 Tax=Laccaria bicolor (strain S238N-H82 / ATCC MYA-4686) TaxID=486041 RepID=B0D4G4_LACBS|nr:uncharacterized protein LACBIDRAFT_317122 [Laccaria bicolor S238N-H82]EDR10340.1 predicted protein [Laccaria bicolor S238N-H82]|eukprot:XP_001878790.1 predicted protein [Laccaria bicolor S238N-H82]
MHLCCSSLWLPRLLLGPCAPPSPALSLLCPAGVVSAPPSPLVGGPVCNLGVHLQNLLDCVLLTLSVTLIYLSASERVAVSVYIQQALTGFNWLLWLHQSNLAHLQFKTTRQRHNILQSLNDLFGLKIKKLGVTIILLLLEMCSCSGCGSES